MGKYCLKHIGKKFNGGNLIVVDGGDKHGYVKVKCDVCAEDSELHGEAIFETNFHSLTLGKVPCGCTKNPMWSLEQYKILITRKILKESLPIEFDSFESIATPLTRSSVKFLCKSSNITYLVSRLSDFFKGAGNYGIVWSVEAQIKKFNRDNQDREVWDTLEKIKTNNVLGYYCKICERNGNEPLYTTSSNTLFHRGNIPCMCSKHPASIPTDYYLNRAKQLLIESKLDGITTIGLIQSAGRKNVCVVFICAIHGVYKRYYKDLQRVGCGCQKCSPPLHGYNTQKKGYIYVLDIQTPKVTIIGYGITNNLNNRLTTHKRNLRSIGATITNIHIFEGSGTAVLNVENSIKSLHQTGLIDCDGFRRESISIDRKAEVLEKCTKLKEIDNVDKVS